jgi:GDP-mannose 6-dehydrogenase
LEDWRWGLDISVFGLGYVGSVTAAAFARCGHRVIGVDASIAKSESFGKGVPPVLETGLAELLAEGHRAGRILTATGAREAVAASQASLVCVGTPSRVDGSSDLSQVMRVFEEIGDAIAEKREEHVVVLRSTVPPGTTVRCATLLAERASPAMVHVAFNPEFLREGSAIKDFFDPPFTVVGAISADAEAAVRELYQGIPGEFIVVPIEVAEMAKMVANAWHANKIAFANEIGRIASFLNVDGSVVMDLMTKDKKLNISPAYLRPGFAFGGSCLPKDVRSLSSIGRQNGIPLPLIDSLLETNRIQIERAAQLVLAHGQRDVGMLGLAFKPGTEDLRESPAVALAELLIGKGCRLRIHDPTVQLAKLVGANRAYVELHLPHLSELLVDADTLIAQSRLLVLTNGAPEYTALISSMSQTIPVIDVARTGRWHGLP